MRIVDPDCPVHQPAEFRIGGPRLELHQQTVPRRAPSSDHGVEGPGRRCHLGVALPFVARGSFVFGQRLISRGRHLLRRTGRPRSGSGRPWVIPPRRPPRASIPLHRLGNSYRRAHWRTATLAHVHRPCPASAAASALRRGDRPATAAAGSRRRDLRARAPDPAPAGRCAAVLLRGAHRPTRQLSRDHFLNGFAVGEVRAPRAPVRMKSFLLSVRHAARSGASISPVMCDRAAGARPSQSHPRLMILPNVLIAIPSRSAGSCTLRSMKPLADGVRRRPSLTEIGTRSRAPLRVRQLPSIDLERHPVTVMPPQQVLERGIEQRLEMPSDHLLEIARVEQRRQLVRQGQSHRRATRRHQAGRRNPFPGRTMTGCKMPPRGDVRGAAPGFGDDFARHEQPELDAHAGKSDSLAARLGARRHVVYRASSRRCMPRPSSTIVSVASTRLVRSWIRAAPESSPLATTSVRIVSSRAPVYASRRSSRRCWRSTRVSPTWASYRLEALRATRAQAKRFGRTVPAIRAFDRNTNRQITDITRFEASIDRVLVTLV